MFGWTMVPQVYAAAMLVTAIRSGSSPTTTPSTGYIPTSPSATSSSALKDPVVWKYCQYYSIVFGGYVGLALWMTKYYVNEYGFDLKTAACWRPASPCRAACCARWAAGCPTSTARTR
jgi:NNP family nitrate/nitrite transporter-like MFS transporter